MLFELDDWDEWHGDEVGIEVESNKEELKFQYGGMPQPSMQIQDTDVFASWSA